MRPGYQPGSLPGQSYADMTANVVPLYCVWSAHFVNAHSPLRSKAVARKLAHNFVRKLGCRFLEFRMSFTQALGRNRSIHLLESVSLTERV